MKIYKNPYTGKWELRLVTRDRELVIAVDKKPSVIGRLFIRDAQCYASYKNSKTAAAAVAGITSTKDP